MLIDQGDLLWGMNRSFIKNFLALSSKVNFEKETVIFREADKADFFYTLVTGQVRLTIGEPPREIYLLAKAGEGFGWSSLIDRNYYSATAESLEPTLALKFKRDDLSNFLLKDAESASAFYKRVAGMIASRLIQCYRLINAVP